MLYIGIDLGTSSVKLLLMDSEGKIQNVVSKKYPLSYPYPGWSEQQPADWWHQTLAGLKELTENVDKSKIAGIGVGGQMHGLVILDKSDQVIRPAILWNDGRTIKETDYLNNIIGKEKLSEYTANIAFAGFTAPKILWVRENEPDNYNRINKIMLPKDYLTYQLTGVHACDYSDASGMLLLDVKNKCWSRPMLDICGITDTQMPELFESYEAVGTLRPEVALELGFPPSTRVAAGAGDNAAAAIGTGTIGEGNCNISIGTSGTIFISSENFCVDPYNALHAFVHADGHYHLLGCMLSAASCNQWWMDSILKTQNYSREQQEISDEKLGCNRVYFLPYLMGERSPHNNPLARGTLIGMTMDTTRSDITQAILEGVAFGVRDSLEVARNLGINVNRSKICGGGAKSAIWKKIIANALNISLDIVEAEEGPGYGGAILATVACGECASIEEATERFVKIVDSIEPDPEIASRYEDRYRIFRQIYPTLKPLFPSIA